MLLFSTTMLPTTLYNLSVQPLPLSDSSLIIHLGETIDPLINRRAHLLAAALSFDLLPGVSETVPGYASLVVHYDPLILTHAQVADWLMDHLDLSTDAASHSPKKIEVPVTYDGPDLDFVAAHCRLTRAEVIRQHTKNEYIVYMTGFSPGFPYLGIVPAPIRVPRLAIPRSKVLAGSIAIAGEQTGIYPIDSPGGWRLLGHTTLTLFDPQRESPFLFAPGDMVKFVAR